MTIYAIVNEIFSTPTQATEAVPVWTLITPSAILQGGNPYFVPDFASGFEAWPALAVRIGKLGKSVAPRFAYRYVEAVAPAVVFAAADLLKRLREQGMPWTQAISYDRSLAIGKFRTLDFELIADCECSLTLRPDGCDDKTILHRSAIRPPLEETIRAVSRDNTLKTGDILLVGLSGHGPEVKPGIRALLSLNGEESLRFNIR